MGRRVGSPPQLIFLILHNTHVEAINLPVRSRRDDDSKGYNPAAVEPVTMSDETIEAAVEHFLDETESSLDSYEQGYADADDAHGAPDAHRRVSRRRRRREVGVDGSVPD